MTKKGTVGQTKEVPITDALSPIPQRQVRGRPFEKGRSGHPGGRRAGSRNKKTLAAALLEGESEALTKRAVELALAGNPWTFSPRALSRGGDAALHRTHPAALPRADGQV